MNHKRMWHVIIYLFILSAFLGSKVAFAISIVGTDESPEMTELGHIAEGIMRRTHIQHEIRDRAIGYVAEQKAIREHLLAAYWMYVILGDGNNAALALTRAALEGEDGTTIELVKNAAQLRDRMLFTDKFIDLETLQVHKDTQFLYPVPVQIDEILRERAKKWLTKYYVDRIFASFSDWFKDSTKTSYQHVLLLKAAQVFRVTAPNSPLSDWAFGLKKQLVGTVIGLGRDPNRKGPLPPITFVGMPEEILPQFIKYFNLPSPPLKPQPVPPTLPEPPKWASEVAFEKLPSLISRQSDLQGSAMIFELKPTNFGLDYVGYFTLEKSGSQLSDLFGKVILQFVSFGAREEGLIKVKVHLLTNQYQVSAHDLNDFGINLSKILYLALQDSNLVKDFSLSSQDFGDQKLSTGASAESRPLIFSSEFDKVQKLLNRLSELIVQVKSQGFDAVLSGINLSYSEAYGPITIKEGSLDLKNMGPKISEVKFCRKILRK